eukprot:4818931-Pyramimonas_sp.AAC.1
MVRECRQPTFSTLAPRSPRSEQEYKSARALLHASRKNVASRRKRLLVGGAKLTATLKYWEPEWQRQRR